MSPNPAITRLRIPGRKALAVLFLLSLLSTGCRKGTPNNLDLTPGSLQLQAGEKQEVQIKALRHADVNGAFRVELQAPPDVTITPSVIEFPGGHRSTAKVTVEVNPNARQGPRTIKVRTSENVATDGTPWVWTVKKGR